MSEKYAIVYNTSSNSVVYDDAGRVVAPQEWAAVQRSRVQEYIASEELIVTDPSTINELSNTVAFAAKQEYDRLVAEWEAERNSKNDYDGDSKPEPSAATASEPKTSKRR